MAESGEVARHTKRAGSPLDRVSMAISRLSISKGSQDYVERLTLTYVQCNFLCSTPPSPAQKSTSDSHPHPKRLRVAKAALYAVFVARAAGMVWQGTCGCHV